MVYVPPKIIADGSKEQTVGVFGQKIRQVDCWLIETDGSLQPMAKCG
jgi:hypothetical protein